MQPYQLKVKPGQTRRWSRINPTVMVGGNKTITNSRNRGIPKTQRVLTSTKIIFLKKVDNLNSYENGRRPKKK